MRGLIQRAEGALRVLAIAVVVGVPLLVMRPANDPFNVPKLALLVVAVTVGAALYAVRWAAIGKPRTLDRLLVPAGCVLIPLALAWLASPYKGWSLWGEYSRFPGLLPYVAAVAAGFIVAHAFAGRTAPLMRALAATGVATGAYAILQGLGLDPFTWTLKGEAVRPVVSTLGNANFAGAFLAITLPFAAHLALSERRRALWGAGTLVVGAGCLATVSLGALAAAAAATAVIGSAYLGRRYPPLRRAGFVAAVFVALAVIAGPAAYLFGADMPLTIERRGDFWAGAVSMTVDNPVVGRGPGAFAVEYPRYRTQSDADLVGLDITDDPHSIPLSFATSAGIPGLVGFVAAAAWVVRLGWRHAEDTGAMAFAAAAVAYLVQALVSIDTIPLRTTFWIVVGGLVAATTVEERAKRAKAKRDRRAATETSPKVAGVAAAALLLAFVGVWQGTSILSADLRFAAGSDAFSSGDLTVAKERWESAIATRADPLYRRTYGNTLGRAANALGEPGRPLMEDVREAFAFVDEVPDVNAIVDHARVLAEWREVEPDARDDAAELYLRAVRLDPKDRNLFGEALGYALTVNALESGLSMIEASELPRTELAGWYAEVARAFITLRELGPAREVLETAATYDPQSVAVLDALELLEEHEALQTQG